MPNCDTFFVDSTKEMGTDYIFLWHAARKCPIIQFKTGSLLWCLHWSIRWDRCLWRSARVAEMSKTIPDGKIYFFTGWTCHSAFTNVQVTHALCTNASWYHHDGFWTMHKFMVSKIGIKFPKSDHQFHSSYLRWAWAPEEPADPWLIYSCVYSRVKYTIIYLLNGI